MSRRLRVALVGGDHGGGGGGDAVVASGRHRRRVHGSRLRRRRHRGRCRDGRQLLLMVNLRGDGGVGEVMLGGGGRRKARAVSDILLVMSEGAGSYE